MCRGLDFGIPPQLAHEMIDAEFELCWHQLERTGMTTALDPHQRECKAALAHLSKRYANAKIDRTGYPLGKEQLRMIGDMKRNKNIVITRPDKGNGVVVMSRDDYVKKMDEILSDSKKFQRLGSVEEHDNTLQQERALQAFLLRAHKNGNISKEIYERIRPVGASRPRLYGLPKLHKDGVPLRPILSMINAPQHELAKWLAEVLHPVVTKFGCRTLKDTFEFCEKLELFAAENDVENAFMCSYDIVSLFTNIPIDETINIVLDTLYRDEQISPPPHPENLLRKLLIKATTEVEFSFNNVMFKQIDGVAMGSPLGPVLANVFVGYHESRIKQEQWPQMYDRFVDDTFSVFGNDRHAFEFLDILNGLHPNLKFTMEVEANSTLPFMDVLVQRIGKTFVRSVYRKPTFTGLYMRWDSFSPTRTKISLIRSLAIRALKICSQSTLADELEKLRVIFLENGYPSSVIETTFQIVVKPRLNKPPLEPDKKMKVFLRLPWIGPKGEKFRAEILDIIGRGFPRVKADVVFTTRKAFSGRAKDVLPATSQSLIIYEFTCRCSRAYVGKTTQVLGERIKQHIPDRLFVNLRGRPDAASSDSAITKHLIEHRECADKNVRTNFTVLAKARHSQHLDVLEALYIKSRSPELCHQKKTLHVLSLL